MFGYDPQILAAIAKDPVSVAEVLAQQQAIDGICQDDDGLKWFNWLYFQVTLAVENRVKAGGFQDADWLALLDVEFAKLYFKALRAFLTNEPTPECWQIVFAARQNRRLARIQFALAGINAHINHDLPSAIDTTCADKGDQPAHGSPQYRDFTDFNTTLAGIVETAKKELHVRLAGDELPEVGHLEQAIAAWGVAAARESAWQNAEHLWALKKVSLLENSFLDMLDGFSTVIGKTLLIPV